MKQNLFQLIRDHVLTTILGVKRYFILYEYTNQCVPTPDGSKRPRHEISTDIFNYREYAESTFRATHNSAPNAYINSISIHSFRVNNVAIQWQSWLESILSRLLGRKYFFVLLEFHASGLPQLTETSTNIFFSLSEAQSYSEYIEKVSHRDFHTLGIYSFRTRYPITEHSLWRDRQDGKSLSTISY